MYNNQGTAVMFLTWSGPEGSSHKCSKCVQWFLFKEEDIFMNNSFDKDLIKQTLVESKKAFDNNDVPVGAILVIDNKIVCRSHNKCVANNNKLYHAEILAINEAIEKGLDLSKASLYISIEPCLMCLGAIINAGINKIYFGAFDKTEGAFTHFGVSLTIHEVEVHYLENKDCSKIMSSFFEKVRNK